MGKPSEQLQSVVDASSDFLKCNLEGVLDFVVCTFLLRRNGDLPAIVSEDHLPGFHANLHFGLSRRAFCCNHPVKLGSARVSFGR